MADTKVAAIIFYVIIRIGGGNMPGKYTIHYRL